MFKPSITNTKVTFLFTLAVLALGASLCVVQAPQAHAEENATGKNETSASKSMTTSDLQAQIVKLQSKLRELTGTKSASKQQFKVGMNVEITDSLRIRGSASINGKFIGVQNKGARGVVVEGPIMQGGHSWVKVDYESGPDGWNASSWLKQHTSPSKPADETFTVSVSNLKATVSFRLSNGCGGYIINWGDGQKTELAGSATGSMCTMAIVNVAKEHTYAKAGTYKIKVERFNGPNLEDTSVREIKVGLGAKLSTSTNPVIGIGCLSGSANHPEGTKLQSITENGQTRTIADASFVCRKGTWVVDGTLVKPVSPVCIMGSLPNSVANKVECLTESISSTTPVVSPRGCRFMGKDYLEGVTQPVSRFSSRPVNTRIVPLTCQGGEWKPITKPATPTGVGSTSTTPRSGSVRGVSTDILTEISVTLTTIKNIISELK